MMENAIRSELSPVLNLEKLDAELDLIHSFNPISDIFES
jgi:hypothetical protein